MAARIIINPVVATGNTRIPKCATMIDPGRPLKTYGHTSAISDGLPGQRNANCVSFVTGIDLTPLDTDPEIETLFEDADPTLSGIRARLAQTPNQLGWDAAKQQRVRDRLVNHSVNVTGINADTPLWQIVNRICQEFSPAFDIRQAWAAVPGA